MNRSLAYLALLGLLPFSPGACGDGSPKSSAAKLNPGTRLEMINSQPQWQDYRGRQALRVAPLPGHEHAVGEIMLAVLSDTDFQDGTIEVDVAGAPRPGSSPAEKGFIGASFRVRDEKDKNTAVFRGETIFVRPVNARLEEQLFRNRSTQYASDPDYPWSRLREESPGVYESYVDMETGEWTKLKIEVSGTKARLYVNGADQPCLIVNDFKQGDSRGKIALWADVTTDAYFSNLKVTLTPRPQNAH